MKNMKEKILSIKGGEFKEWYSSLSSIEKIEHRKATDSLQEEWSNKKNYFSDPGIRKLSEEIMYLALESEDDYEGAYVIEEKLKEHFKI